MHLGRRRSSLALALLVITACPGDPGGTSAATSDTADATTSATGDSLSMSSTSDPTSDSDGTTTITTTTTTTGVETTTTTTTTGEPGCGDGIAEEGEVCFELLALEDLWIDHIALADINEDGHLDLVGLDHVPCPLVDPDDPVLAAAGPAAPAGVLRDGASTGFLRTALGDGAGGFTSALDTQLPYEAAVDPTVADFTGDNHLDLAIATATYDPMTFEPIPLIVVFPGDGAGGLGPGIESILEVDVRTLDVGDLDGDGHLDLVAASYFGLSVLRGDGQGHFTPTILDEATYDEPTLRDLDGDGDLDLVALRAPVDAAIQTFLGAGDGTFTAGQTLAFDGAITHLAVLDPAKGERAAILAPSYKSKVGYRLHLLEILDDGALAPPELVPDVTADQLAVGQFDGGPRPDVVISGDSLFALVGAEPWSPASSPIADQQLYVQSRMAVGDVDEDGVDDVVIPELGLWLLRSNP